MLFSSCKEEETKPDSLIDESSFVRISLDYEVEGEINPFAHTDLDLGLFNSGNELIETSENIGAEEILLASGSLNQTYTVKVRRFEKKDDKQVRFTAFVTNSNGGERKEFTGVFNSSDEASRFSWETGVIQTVIKIEKSGNEFNVVSP